MNMKMYFDRMSRSEINAFAARYGRGFDYVKKFLLSSNEDLRRIPSRSTMHRLIRASQHELKWIHVLSWFYPDVQEELEGVLEIGGESALIETATETETNRMKQINIKSAPKRQCVTGDQSQNTEIL